MKEEHELELVSIRLIKEKTLYSEDRLTSPAQVVGFLSRELALYDREMFAVLNLTSQNQVINLNLVSMGDINSSIVNPREVFKSSILSNAASILLMHNHPSGYIYPSEEDQAITERLCAAGELLGIPVMDHVIIGGRSGERFSFMEHELLPGQREPVKKINRNRKVKL